MFVDGAPTPRDRGVLSDIGYDLMMESGQYFQAIAIDSGRSAEGSYFLRNVLRDGLAA